MNFLESDIAEQQKQNYPQLIQQAVDALNNSYVDLENQQSALEQKLRQAMTLKSRSQIIAQVRREAEQLQVEQLEVISANFAKLVKLINDPLQNISEVQQNELQVIASRFRSLIPGKKKELQEFKNQANRAQTQYEEVEVQQNEQQLEKQRLIDIQLTEKEEHLVRDQKAINEIAKDVDIVLDIVGNITNEVYNQKQLVDKIEIGVTQADEEIDRGIDELLEAEKKQTVGKKFRWIAIACCAVAVVVLIIVLCFAFI